MFKDYLTYENARNHKNHALYERFMRLAVGSGANILVAHHLTFEVDGQDPNEVPSADTLMFCHELMARVFGEDMYYAMAQLAVRPPEQRDAHLGWLLDQRERGSAIEVKTGEGETILLESGT